MHIKEYAFYYCKNLENIKIHDGIASIGYAAFGATKFALAEENWKNGVLYLGKYLLESANDNLKRYTIKQGTKLVADGAFRYCHSLKTITIPKSVTSIGKNAFGFCYNKNYKLTKIAKFKIKGKKNSAAEKYAKKNKFKFVKI